MVPLDMRPTCCLCEPSFLLHALSFPQVNDLPFSHILFWLQHESILASEADSMYLKRVWASVEDRAAVQR